jgi:catalase
MTSTQRVSDFDQPRALWSKVMTEGERERLTSGIAAHLKNARPEIQQMALTRLFEPVDQALARAISDKMQAAMQGKAFYTAAIPPSPLLNVTGTLSLPSH